MLTKVSKSAFSNSTMSLNDLAIFLATVSPTKRMPNAKITLSKGISLLCIIPLMMFSADLSPIRSRFLMSSVVN